ncbi:unnamed protein product [Ostreobium quekettii]|uniref:Uncharacterized protein n=1 Tax=Ostreobium quekettii TaxID=121088 RepID=A0A8S1IRH3_9CHLO|nr:unnamed protein product [Ostreobium quekettii]
MLEVLHCRALLEEGFVSHWDPAGSAKHLVDVAVRAGVASKDTTLLLLHEAQQFLDNGVPCPEDHPGHAKWKELEKKGREGGEADKRAAQEGRIRELEGYVKLYQELGEFERPEEAKDKCKKRKKAGRDPFAESGAWADEEDDGVSESGSDDGEGYGGSQDYLQDLCYVEACEDSLEEEEEEEDDDCDMGFSLFDGSSSVGGARDGPSERPRPSGAPPAGSGRIPLSAPCSAMRKESPCQAPPPALGGVVVAKPLTGEEYLNEIKEAFGSECSPEEKLEKAYWQYMQQRKEHEDRPSFYVYAADCFREHGADAGLCVNIISNVLEMQLRDAQTSRVVAYHMISHRKWDDAVCLLEAVEEMAPEEPQSHLDIAWCRFMRVRQDPGACADLGAELRCVIAKLVKVAKGQWPERFSQIEWPALLLLSWVVDWADRECPGEGETHWPEGDLPSKCRIEGIRLALLVWMGWDTDHTDIDLHVREPDQREVYYGRNRSDFTGAHLSKDFTQGYGPEVYILRKGVEGQYVVSANYFASHQASMTTGGTSAVLWTVKNLGSAAEEEVEFKSARLTSNKQKEAVLTVNLPRSQAGD